MQNLDNFSATVEYKSADYLKNRLRNELLESLLIIVTFGLSLDHSKQAKL